MSEDLVIRYCSPTLAGIKTGSLFSCDCPCRKALTKALSGLNTIIRVSTHMSNQVLVLTLLSTGKYVQG